MSENKAITLQQAKTLYEDLRQRQENIPSAENIVMVQDQQPTVPANKVWLTETPPAGVDVPTYQEFTGVIAPDYADLDFPVSAGEHCIHNGVLYTAVQNINASEAWTAAHWEAGSVSSKLTEISNAIDGVGDDVDDLLEHETYSASGEATTEYIPVVEKNHVDSNFIQINGYDYATFGSPFGGTTKIYPVEIGKTYKAISDGKSESPKMPFLIVADTSVTSGVIGTPNTYDSVLSESETENVEEIEYTALRTGYLYITASNSSCGLWEKREVTPTDRKYYIDDFIEHETYIADGETTTEYIPIVENSHEDSKFLFINGYNYATLGGPSDSTVRIYPVTNGKTYKVVGRGKSTEQAVLIVKDSVSMPAAPDTYDYAYGTHETETVEEIEYTALRTGYLYITASNSSCGLWEKKTITHTERKFHIDDVRNNVADIDSVISKIIETKIDSSSRPSKVVPKNAEPVAKVTNLANSVTLVRSILSRNVANKNAVGDVVVDSIGTTKKGIKTAWVPPGGYWIDLGNMGIYSMVKYFEKGVYSATLWQDQFPMRVGITDPAGGFFVFYAENVSQLGDVSGLFVGKQRDGESVLPFEEYVEKTYTPEDLADDNRIEVVPYGIIEFVNSNNSAVASTVEYTLFGKNDDTTTRKDFIISPDGTKYLPMIKNDGSVVAARVVPKKALFIGNSLTSGWQTFGEAATESDKDFVGRFGDVVADLDSNYTFSRKWSTQFEQQTSLANAQAWVTTNIDPLLSSDLDLIVVQLSDNVLGNASVRETFPSSSLWLLQHLRETCPKARVIWLGVWFDRLWVTTLLNNTAQTGCEYVDMRPLYLPENVSYIGEVYKMESPYQKEYTVDSFTVDDGAITMVFTVDGKQYTSTIPSYTSYESSGSTLTVTGIYHVVSTYYESIHPNDEGFRKIANKLLFDLGISDSEETIPADE